MTLKGLVDVPEKKIEIRWCTIKIDTFFFVSIEKDNILFFISQSQDYYVDTQIHSAATDLFEQKKCFWLKHT